ncbi:MAG: CTP synthase, partial [Rikenellaceae bacterium]
SQNSLVVHLTLIPYLSASGELKTKPTQHSVKTLLEAGVQPDILVLRTEKELSEELKQKVALFCNVDRDAVIQSIDVPTIYEVPIRMMQQNFDLVALRKLGLKVTDIKLDKWIDFVERVKNPKQEIKIALVGKYTELPDAYKSIVESFVHAGAANNTKVRLEYVNSEEITNENSAERFAEMSGILVAPGFGGRGTEGKMSAIKFARENNVPFFGICLGMQCAVIEFARNVLGFVGANSTEMSSTKFPVIDLMEEQKGVTEKGGTMRLGSYPCNLMPGTKSYEAYGCEQISERHRHRYEFNNKYINDFREAGMVPVGINPDTNLVEVVEIPAHPWFVGVQYHPEYKSTVVNPHPLFVSFVKAAIEYKNSK